MAKQRFTAEEIIHKLREADVLIGQGKTIAEACTVKPLDVSILLRLAGLDVFDRDASFRCPRHDLLRHIFRTVVAA